MNIVVLLTIVFWTAGVDIPVPGQILFFPSMEECREKGMELDKLWVAEHKGNTSWACLVAEQDVEEKGV